jgi:hypothetical protein
VYRSKRGSEDASAKARLDALASALRAGNVAVVEVLHIPTEALFRSAITPEILERSWQDGLTVRMIDDLLAGNWRLR